MRELCIHELNVCCAGSPVNLDGLFRFRRCSIFSVRETGHNQFPPRHFTRWNANGFLIAWEALSHKLGIAVLSPSKWDDMIRHPPYTSATARVNGISMIVPVLNEV